MFDYTPDENNPEWYQYRNSITKIVIGYGVTEIGDLAFYNCIKAEEVVFERNADGESSVISIGNNAFRNCLSLTEIEIPASVETIGDYAFRGCNSLTSLVFEEGSKLTSIEKNCFFGNTDLEECIIPSKVTSIGNYAFRGCSSLKRFYYPAGAGFGTEVFYIGSALEYFGKYTVNESDKTCSVEYMGVTQNGDDYTPDENAAITAAEIVIPEKIDGYKVTSVKIGTATVNVPESIEDHMIAGLSDVTALNGWTYTADTDAIAKGESLDVTATYNLSAAQKLIKQITVTRPDCKDEDKDHVCDLLCGEAVSECADFTDPDQWETDGDSHWHVCPYCNEVSDKAAHGGGIADCKYKAECADCGAEYGETDSTNHGYIINEWAYDESGHWRGCSCGAVVDEGAHVSDNGKVTTPATAATAGVKTYSCTVCGYVIRTEVIPATGNSGGAAGRPQPSVTTPAYTGTTTTTVTTTTPADDRDDVIYDTVVEEDTDTTKPADDDYKEDDAEKDYEEDDAEDAEDADDGIVSDEADDANPGTGVAVCFGGVIISAVAVMTAGKRKKK